MKISIQICSGREWRATKTIFNIQATDIKKQALGEYFQIKIKNQDCMVFHSGPTKTRAAAACQHAIDKWNPDVVVVLGTCGGVAPNLQVFDVVLARKTVQYDCLDFMDEAKSVFYPPMAADLDISWIKDTRGAFTVGTIGTADRDLDFETAKKLRKENILTVDWESGAISKICEINNKKCLILRGITDKPVAQHKTDREQQTTDYKQNTFHVMEKLFALLPGLIGE